MHEGPNEMKNADVRAFGGERMEKPKKRLTASERESMVRLSVAFEILSTEPKILKERSKLVPGARRDMAMMAAKITKLLHAFMDTVPDIQIPAFQHSLRMSSYVIGVKRPGAAARDDKNYGIWLPNETINGLLEGCHEHCLMCNYDRAERNRCKFRKTLDSIPNDVEDRADGDCPYYTII